MKAKLKVFEVLIQSNEKTLRQQKEEYEIQLARERESCRRLVVENHESKSNINSLEHKNLMLKADIIRKDATITSKDATIASGESELNAKTKTLEEKGAIISGLSEQLTRTREHLSSKQQVSSDSLCKNTNNNIIITLWDSHH